VADTVKNMLLQISQNTKPWQRQIGIAILLLVATLAVYGQVVHHDFINYDDPQYVTENLPVSGGLTLAGVKWAFSSLHASNWHPLTWLSHMLDVQLFGLNPAGHHGSNLFWHCVATVLLFFLLHRLSGSVWQSGIVAALFALHPLHVESVAWVAERKDVLSATFWMLTLLCYVRFVESPRADWYCATCICLALGLMAKPMLVTLPFVMLLMDYWPLGRLTAVPEAIMPLASRRSIGYLVYEKLPFLVLVGASCVISSYAQRQVMSTFETIPLVTRIANALVSYLAYLVKMMLPLQLAPFYPYDHQVPLWQGGGALILLALVTFGVWRQRQVRPYLLVGWLWYLGTLVPVIGIVQVGLQGMADRYTYLPLIGAFIMLVWGGADLLQQWGNRRLVATGTVLLLAGCAIMSWRQVARWRDSETLFAHSLAVNDKNYLAHYCVGLVQAKAGKLDAATRHYERAIALVPWWSDPYVQFGHVHASRKNLDAALAMYDRAIALDANACDAHYHRANLLADSDRLDDAVAGYLRALACNPRSADAQYRLALVYHRRQQLNEAAMAYAAALALAPNVAATHANLGAVLASLGQPEDAIRHYQEAIRIDPQSATAHHNLATLFQRLRQLPAAADHFRQALLINPELAESHNNLGVVLGEQGKAVEAIHHFDMAIRLRPGYDEARRNRAIAVTARDKR
jgi:tetratricopeptide (TPR) repeat protein